ncbi:hypothetical protein D3C71_2002720 [compost metagenome]
MRANGLDHLEIGVVTELGDIVRRGFEQHVNAAGQHFSHTGIGVGDRAVDDRLERRSAVPVVIIA